MKIHNLEHEPDSSDEQQHHVCPACQKKCPTQRQLVLHVVQHSLPSKTGHTERVKCPVCYKAFAHRDRLQVKYFRLTLNYIFVPFIFAETHACTWIRRIKTITM